MTKEVANLIFRIIGNGKPCSKSDWRAIKKELGVVKNPSDNSERIEIYSDTICSYCIHHADDPRICEQLKCSPESVYHKFEGRKLSPVS